MVKLTHGLQRPRSVSAQDENLSADAEPEVERCHRCAAGAE
jgi:hypothetical protein